MQKERIFSMQVVFLTREPAVCTILRQKIGIAADTGMIFEDQSRFFAALESTEQKPDILIIDYRLYDHDFFDLRDFFKDCKIRIPLIFYNDPFPDTGERAAYWEYKCRFYFKNDDICKFRTFFEILEKAVESPDINPYISLIRKPGIFPNTEESQQHSSSTRNNPEYDIYLLRDRCHLQKSLFRLLEILYKQRGRFVPTDYLLKNLKGPGKCGKKNCLYAYISRLRTFINLSDASLDILKNSEGYKLITY
jgi:DNA-binding response OmpR family regulator